MNLITNKNNDEKVENLKVTFSEFFITDIQLNQINYTEKEIEKIIKDNELATSLNEPIIKV